MMLADVINAGPKRRFGRRVGRGTGSGRGTTAGRGEKGNGARSGSGGKLGHEGGTMPLYRRLPRRGFNNFNFRVQYVPVNVGLLDKTFSAGDTVSLEILRQRGLVPSKGAHLKILGDGELSKSLCIEAASVSASARAKIEAAQGTVKLSPVKGCATKGSE